VTIIKQIVVCPISSVIVLEGVVVLKDLRALIYSNN